MELSGHLSQSPPLRAQARFAPRAGLTLIEVVLGLVLSTAVLVACWWYGPLQVARTIRLVALFVVGGVVWGCVYTRAPELTRNVSALLFLGVLALALVPGLLQNSREQARRTHIRNSLREIGAGLQAAEYAQNAPRGDDRSRN